MFIYMYMYTNFPRQLIQNTMHKNLIRAQKMKIDDLLLHQKHRGNKGNIIKIQQVVNRLVCNTRINIAVNKKPPTVDPQDTNEREN